jgi:hypothetical protein
MCEAVLQQEPSYFQSSRDNFSYFICEKYPNLPSDNYAIAFHDTKNDYCSIKTLPHLHVLIYSDKGTTGDGYHHNHQKYKHHHRGYEVPCPFSCFKLLILGGVNFQYCGIIFQKLQTAVVYNDKYPSKYSSIKTCRAKVPKVIDMLKTCEISTQTNVLPHATLERFLTVYNGPYAAEFSQIMDVFISGYGSVFLQNHNMITTFELCCSPAQCLCDSCTFNN